MSMHKFQGNIFAYNMSCARWNIFVFRFHFENNSLITPTGFIKCYVFLQRYKTYICFSDIMPEYIYTCEACTQKKNINIRSMW